MAKKNRLYTYPNGQPSDGQKLQLEFDNIYEGVNNVDTTQILDGAITTVKIANGAVTDAKIATGAITNIKLADEAITDAKVSPTANIAQTKINSTTGWISTSLGTANDTATLAVNTANSAETKANSAVATATSAESKADDAVSVAGNAQALAQNSLDISNVALNTSNTALDTSLQASDTASRAVIRAEQAVVDSQSLVGNTEIFCDVYTIINSNNGDNTFSYKNTADEVFTGVITPEGNQRFELTSNYFTGLNRIEAVVNDSLIRSSASGGLIEVGEAGVPTNLVDLMPLGAGTEVTFKYYMQISLGGAHALSHGAYSKDALIKVMPTSPESWYAGQILLREV